MEAHFLRRQAGNALFLILIAVALFAALSYVVTQSGRGSGSISKETASLAASQIVAGGAALRSAMTRMVVLGTAETAIDFTAAAGEGGCAVPLAGDECSSGSDCIFASDGGGRVALLC